MFDFLALERDPPQAGGSVPFPFTALLRRIAGVTTPDQAPYRAVLIPLGRSLQRGAAAPAFFDFPRVVVAVDGDPREAAGTPSLALRDRLYLGYQPRANVIEVISYNEAAGRFEFQEVTDYRAGGRPTVRYARRAVCMACHQNGGPIFSRGVWSETNANPRVAAAIRHDGDRYQGIEVDRGIDIPDAIEAATRRANQLAAYQWLWRTGCAAQGAGDPAIRCRGQALLAALQFRLSGQQAYDAMAPSFRDDVRGVMVRLADAQAGQGLAIPDPGLPNRNPFSGNAANVTEVADANVSAAFDPLVFRAPLEIWSWREPDALSRRLVAGVAAFTSDADIRRLDAHLFATATARGAPRREVALECDVGLTSLGNSRQRVAFACGAKAERRSPLLEGSLIVAGTRVEEGVIGRMAFEEDTGVGEALRNIEILPGTLGATQSRIATTLRIARNGVHVRRSDGNAIETVRLQWIAPQSGANVPVNSVRRANGTAVITVMEDFAPVRDAVAAMQDRTRDGTTDALSAAPFRRAAVLSTLERKLAMPSRSWCCLESRSKDTIAIDDRVPGAVDATAPLAADELAFYRNCALCHRSGNPVPANFLAGTPHQVRANLAHCAERLYVRLAMWDHAPEGRAKTPMPPATALRSAGISDPEWRAGPDLAALRGYVAKILRSESGKDVSPESLLRTNYERLRDCLPRGG